MKEIPLTQGKVALIDDEDYERIVRYSWQASRLPGASQKYVAKTQIRGKTVFMHRLILDAKEGEEIDHISGGGLDNQKSNLRFCSRSQNMANQGKRLGTSSRFKGVSRDWGRNKWLASICFNYRAINLGRYDDEEEAARAYDHAASKYFGEFARLNFPP